VLQARSNPGASVVHRRKVNIPLLMGGTLSLFGLGVGGAWLRPPPGPDQTLLNRFGDVSWTHEQHARMPEIANCQVCHHTERPGTTQPRPCHDCHKPLEGNLINAGLHVPQNPVPYEGENGPPAFTAFHDRCIGCHRALDKGPTLCGDCHEKKHVGDQGVVTWNHTLHARVIAMPSGKRGERGCHYCHHKAEFGAADSDMRPCRSCHLPAAVLGLATTTGLREHDTAQHGACAGCHVVNDPEEDLRSCEDCHAGWVREVDDRGSQLPPSIEQAIHARCDDCHQPRNPELEAGMPARCDDCHRPDASRIADLHIGTILWDHDQHARFIQGGKCDTCHHAEAPGQPIVACRKCHGTGLYDNPSHAEALRRRCLACHEENATGLISWDRITPSRDVPAVFTYRNAQGALWWDHRAHAVGYSLSCRNCHHTLLKEGTEFITPEGAGPNWREEALRLQSCRNCHGPDGPVAGSVAAGTGAVALDVAMQKTCEGCHQKLGVVPTTWEELLATGIPPGITTKP
jgi:hypothetical protein